MVVGRGGQQGAGRDIDAALLLVGILPVPEIRLPGERGDRLTSNETIVSLRNEHIIDVPITVERSQRECEGVKTMTTTFSEHTLAETIDHLNRRGFTGHFGVTPNGLRELGTGVIFRAEELQLCDCVRFEGVSDPGDMAIVYTIESRTGVRGTLVDACGIYANPAVSEFMARVATALAAMPRDRARAA